MNDEDKEFVELIQKNTRKMLKYIEIFNRYTNKHMDSFIVLHIGILFDDMEDCLKKVETQLTLLTK